MRDLHAQDTVLELSVDLFGVRFEGKTDDTPESTHLTLGNSIAALFVLAFAPRFARYDDLVVIDRDPFGVPPGELKDLKVILTIVGGKVVYDAKTAVSAGSRSP